jgi:hypothetical protein
MSYPFAISGQFASSSDCIQSIGLSSTHPYPSQEGTFNLLFKTLLCILKIIYRGVSYWIQTIRLNVSLVLPILTLSRRDRDEIGQD